MGNGYTQKSNKPWYGNPPHHYESDNEAKWAVFFDNAGIKYVPHPTTFETGMSFKGNEIVYTPDFYLCDYNIYCEVKKTDEQLKDIHFQRRVSAAMNENRTPVAHGLLILGPINDFLRNDTKRRCISGTWYQWIAGSIAEGDWIIGRADETDNRSVVHLIDPEEYGNFPRYPHLTDNPHVKLRSSDTSIHASEIIYEAINNAQFAKKNGLFTYTNEDEGKNETQENADIPEFCAFEIPEAPFD